MSAGYLPRESPQLGDGLSAIQLVYPVCSNLPSPPGFGRLLPSRSRPLPCPAAILSRFLHGQSARHGHTLHSGVVVVSTVAGAIDAGDGGLATGDVVYAVNRTPVQGLTDLRAVLDALKVGDAIE